MNGITFVRTTYDAGDNSVQSVEAIIGRIEDNQINDQWMEVTRYSLSDTLAYLQQPSIALNANGWAAVGYQYIPMAQDTIRPSQGETRLMTVNLNESSPQWKTIVASDKIGNQLNFVWSLNTAMNDNDNLYLFTQEKDTLGASSSEYSKRVGNEALNLMLRTVRLSANGEIVDVEEPSGTTSNLTDNIPVAQEMLFNYPNPFSSSTTFEFSIPLPRQVSLTIKDVQGMLVATLIDNYLSEGKYQTIFQSGSLSESIYFVELALDNVVYLKKIVIIK